MQNTKLVIGEKINVRMMHLPLKEKIQKKFQKRHSLVTNLALNIRYIVVRKKLFQGNFCLESWVIQLRFLGIYSFFMRLFLSEKFIF